MHIWAHLHDVCGINSFAGICFPFVVIRSKPRSTLSFATDFLCKWGRNIFFLGRTGSATNQNHWKNKFKKVYKFIFKIIPVFSFSPSLPLLTPNSIPPVFIVKVNNNNMIFLGGLLLNNFHFILPGILFPIESEFSSIILMIDCAVLFAH